MAPAINVVQAQTAVRLAARFRETGSPLEVGPPPNNAARAGSFGGYSPRTRLRVATRSRSQRLTLRSDPDQLAERGRLRHRHVHAEMREEPILQVPREQLAQDLDAELLADAEKQVL